MELSKCITLIKKRKETGYKSFYKQTCNEVYSIASTLTETKEDAIQLMQEVYIHIYRITPSLNETVNIDSAWLKGITSSLYGTTEAKDVKMLSLPRQDKKELYYQIGLTLRNSQEWNFKTNYVQMIMMGCCSLALLAGCFLFALDIVSQTYKSDEEKQQEMELEVWLDSEREFRHDVNGLRKTKEMLPDYYSSKAIELAQAIVDEIIKPDMSEWMKVKTIHDYLCKTVTYDTENYIENTIPTQSYHVFGALNEKIAVCNGYAETFELLCILSDLDAVVVVGNVASGAHAWNRVKIDGNWYNIDVTWDDDSSNLISYTYFCIPDSIMNRSHTPSKSMLRYLNPCVSPALRP